MSRETRALSSSFRPVRSAGIEPGDGKPVHYVYLAGPKVFLPAPIAAADFRMADNLMMVCALASGAGSIAEDFEQAILQIAQSLLTREFAWRRPRDGGDAPGPSHADASMFVSHLGVQRSCRFV